VLLNNALPARTAMLTKQCGYPFDREGHGRQHRSTHAATQGQRLGNYAEDENFRGSLSGQLQLREALPNSGVVSGEMQDGWPI